MGEQRTEELSAEPVANARIIVGVALQRELPARAAVIAVATAQQESRLRNLTYGDSDSLGLFPAETVRGMGEQRPDPRPGVRVDEVLPSPRRGPGWHAKPLTVTAQVVQRSAFPYAYAKWESFAARIVAALTGADADLLTCPTDEVEVNEQTDGLTPRTRRAMHAVMQAFGVTYVGGFCPGGCRTGHITNSDHYTGHAFDFMLAPINDANRQLGDAIAAWLVANANRSTT